MLDRILKKILSKKTAKDQNEARDAIDLTENDSPAAPQATETEEPAAPDYASPPPKEQEQQDFAALVLNGTQKWEPFDLKQMSDLTDDSALCSYYEKSQCKSLSEFLALSEKRFDIRGYWDKCEDRLLFALRSHLKTEKPDLEDEQGTEAQFDSLKSESFIETEPEPTRDTTATPAAPNCNDISEFVDELVSGRTNWQPLYEIEMKDLSSNNGLRYYYELSKSTNLGEFIELGEKRFEIRGYWEGSEKRLKEELTRHFESQTSKAEAAEGPSTNNEYFENYGQYIEDSPEPTPATTAQPDQTSEENLKQTETAAPSPATTHDPDKDLIINAVEEPPATKGEDENEAQYAFTTSVEETTQGLLTGDLRIETFDTLCMGDISNDVRLRNIYNDSKMKNVSEFLALGKKRMEMKNYGKHSERKLKEGIETYLSKYGHATSLFAQSSKREVTINHDSLFAALRKKGNAEKTVSARVWEKICRDLKKSPLANQKIASIAAELKIKWPISQKSLLSDKSIIDYLDCSIIDICNIDSFGHKKVKAYVACVIYLHKLHTVGGISEPRSLEETISTLWENSHLSDQEKKVLHLRFGIQEERKHTLTEIKEHFGISRERVRQIEKNALTKLRMSRHFEDLTVLITKNKIQIWDQLTEATKLKKLEWMEPLEDLLGFEYQIAIELIDYRKHRNTSTSALSNWLDQHFPNDESNWYKTQVDQGTSDVGLKNINPSLEAFLDTL